MTFLNSALLAALSLGLIPILIHLLNRQRFKQVDFPTLRFCRRCSGRRCAACACGNGSAAASEHARHSGARPCDGASCFALRRRITGHGEARASVVLVLDRSVSMRTEAPSGSRFRELQTRAQELIASLGSSDEIQIVWADPTPQLFPDTPTQHRTLLREAIESAAPLESGGSIADAIGTARTILGQSQNLLKEVYVLSDFSESSWPARLPDVPILPNDVRLYVVQVGEHEVQNIGVIDAEITSRLIAPGRPIELSFTVMNSGNDPVNDRIIGAYLDGKRVAQTRLSLKPGETRTEQIRFVPESVGDLSGYVRLEDTDALADDDVRRYVLRVPARLNVAVVGADGAARRLTALAMDPSGAPESFIHASEMTTEQFEGADWSSFDAVFIVDAPALAGGFEERARGYLQTGRGIFVAGGPNFDLRSHGVWMQALGLPAPLDVEEAGDALKRWSKVDLDHPLFEGVFQEKPADVSPEFLKVINTSREKSVASAVIEGAGGNVFLYEVTQGRGRVLFFTSSPDPEWSSMFRAGIFPPLMTGSAAYLAGFGGAGKQLAQSVGQGAELVLRKSEELQYDLVSNENTLRLTASPVSGGQVLKIPPQSASGEYRLRQGERNVMPIVVNIPASESSLSALADDAHLATLGGQLHILKESANVETVIREGRYGRELWKLFLMLALGLLIAEMLIARTPKNEVVPA